MKLTKAKLIKLLKPTLESYGYTFFESKGSQGLFGKKVDEDMYLMLSMSIHRYYDDRFTANYCLSNVAAEGLGPFAGTFWKECMKRPVELLTPEEALFYCGRRRCDIWWESFREDSLEDFFRMIRLTESRMAENQVLKEKIRSSEYLKQRKAQGGDESESFRHILDEIGIKPSVREEKVELSQLSFYNKKTFEACLPFLDASLYEQYAGLVPMVYIDAENNSGIENAFAKDFNETTRFISDYIACALNDMQIECPSCKHLVVRPDVFRDGIELDESTRILSVYLKMSYEEIHRYWKLNSLQDSCEFCLNLLQRAYRQAMAQGWNLPLETLLSIHQQFREGDYRNEKLMKEICIESYDLLVSFTRCLAQDSAAMKIQTYDAQNQQLKAEKMIPVAMDYFENEMGDIQLTDTELIIANKNGKRPFYAFKLLALSQGCIDGARYV